MIQGPHPSITSQQSALVESTMRAIAPSSIQMVTPTPHFNIVLDPADVDF